MLEDGLSYPYRGEWIGRTLIGGVLSIFGFLLIPLFIVNGYTVEVLRETIDGNDTPPGFAESGWGHLLVEGIMMTIISLAYSIVPIGLYFLVTFVFLGTGGAIGGDAGAILSGVGILSLLIFIPIMLVAYYLIPAAIANYAAKDDLSAAFDFQTIKTVVLTGEYFIAILLPIVVGILVMIIAGILSITIIGLLAIPFLQFYAQVSVYRIFGQAYVETAP